MNAAGDSTLRGSVRIRLNKLDKNMRCHHFCLNSQKRHDTVLRLEEDVVGEEEISFFFEIHLGKGVAITLRRVSKTMKPIGCLLVGASPFETAGTSLYDGRELHNWIPKNRAPFHHPAFGHVMKIPSDTCEFGVEGLARVYAKADRMLLDEGSDSIDVVDIFMYPVGRWRGQPD